MFYLHLECCAKSGLVCHKEIVHVSRYEIIGSVNGPDTKKMCLNQAPLVFQLDEKIEIQGNE